MSDSVNPNSLLLDEDGNPIGDVVIADSSPSVPMPLNADEDSDREEAMRATALDLTGEADADSAVAELYPGYADSDLRHKAMREFVTEQRPVDAVAASVGVPARTVAMWIYNGRWDSLAKKEFAVRATQSRLELARIRASKRTSIAQEQIEQARAIRERAAANIRDQVGSLKSNTEAWAAAAKVEHTLVGMSESGDVTDLTEEKKDDKSTGGKTPLVMVFSGNGLPPVRKHM